MKGALRSRLTFTPLQGWAETHDIIELKLAVVLDDLFAIKHGVFGVRVVNLGGKRQSEREHQQSTKCVLGLATL